MEELIERWGWRESIFKELEKLASDIVSEPFKTVFSSLDLEEVAHEIYKCILAWLSEGQSLIPLSLCQSQVVNIVWNVYCKGYDNLHQFNREETLNKVYKEYLEYFFDAELARKFTLREHWMECFNKLKETDQKLNGIEFLLSDSNLPDINLREHEMEYNNNGYDKLRLKIYEEKQKDLKAEFTEKAPSILLNAITKACRAKVSVGKNVSIVPIFSNAHVSEQEKSEVSAEPQGVRYKTTMMLRVNMRFMDLVIKHEFEKIHFENFRLPMLVPPRPWLDRGAGGPLFTRSRKSFREQVANPNLSVNDEMRKRLTFKTQARPVFDALNDLGSTPWIINRPMLDILTRLFEMCFDKENESLLKLFGIPLHPSTVEIPQLINTRQMQTREEYFSKLKEHQKAIKTRNELNSLYRFMLYRIVLADFYRDKVLYFPHDMDFRGRVYPISPYLNHMGDDINRCLLLFARGRPLGKKGLHWLKLHTINMYGHLKRESHETRLKYADENLDKIIDSAERPFDGEKWWLDADSPLLTLASAIEIRNALSMSDPAEYISHLPVHQDGSCNGLQHYAALGRDFQGGQVVNLLPSEKPQDVYSAVAERVEKKRIFDEENETDAAKKEMLSKLRLYLPQPIPRKVIKQTVMTTVYGVTLIGAREQIARQLKALDVPEEEASTFAKYLTARTFECLGETFKASMEIMEWFKKCASAVTRKAGLCRPMEWVTPLGLPVIQPYANNRYINSDLFLEPINMKQRGAFPPNFVHSLDSTHMMLTTLYCRRAGLTFAAVHDCYWTHACSVDKMNEFCRDQFIALYNQPIIEDLSQSMKKFLHKDLPNDEFLELDDLFTPKFKRGELNIEDIRNSVYFFS
uniref:DNA-directed RNA polymerase n=1 Tax=Acrobeloides nanus TaxID=290746 RepID=A0A914BXY0_9BILA